MAQVSRFLGRTAPDSLPDDRILPSTRWVGRILVPVLTVALLILYGFPDRTTELFAWTINPPMTPILMGAGYGTGAYFFYRVATIDRWHKVALVFPGIVLFTWFMGIATLLHWENFNHSHLSFTIWAFLYAVSPFVVPAIWLHNRRTDGHKAYGTSVLLPRSIQYLSGISGSIITITAIILFFRPDPLITYWPWTASPLTARIMLGWFVLFGVVNIAIAFDPRWSAIRIPVQTQVIGFGLLLLGIVRAWGDFDPTNPFTWGFIGGLSLYVLILVGIYYWMESN